MSVLEFWRAHSSELAGLLWQHLVLVAISTGAAIAAGIPIGVLAARHPRAGAPIVWLVNVAQTIPSLAMFGFLLPLPFIGGLGGRVAITGPDAVRAAAHHPNDACRDAVDRSGADRGRDVARDDAASAARPRRAAAGPPFDRRRHPCRVGHRRRHRDDCRGSRCRRTRRVHLSRAFDAGTDRRPCWRHSRRAPRT